MDAQLQRRVQRYGWDRAVGPYEEHWLHRLWPATERLLERAAIAPGERVLDTACGTGVLAIAAAGRVGSSGTVIGTDISEKMIEAARGAASALGLTNCRFERSDAEQSLDLGIRFQVGLCGLGLMYMPDPERAIAALAGQLVPNGKVVVSVWGRRDCCGWADIFPIIDAHVKSEVCPLFFRMGTGDTLCHGLEAAGLKDISTERLAMTLRYGDAREACDAIFLGGPVALAYAHFDEASRAAVRADYLRSVGTYRRGEGYEIPGEIVIGYGVAPA
ncbi:MAG TPA: methyltransferase domain-containing protein [Steroidobacteraceae bacterium]|nr:methyltransferase domain-containing protein [Steroidobacteraceae bacterium]